jgi:hypothetical protein
VKLSIEEKLPDGSTTIRRFWGVSYHPEKRQLRAEYRPQIIGMEADGITPRTDEDSPAHDLRMQEMQAKMAWGDPDFRAESVTKALYVVRICLLDKYWHVGTSGTPQGAARLYDSALFHCWGWAKRPAPHFNFYRPGDPDPDLLLKVKDLQLKLLLYARKKGLDPIAFSYTFAQRNDY